MPPMPTRITTKFSHHSFHYQARSRARKSRSFRSSTCRLKRNDRASFVPQPIPEPQQKRRISGRSPGLRVTALAPSPSRMPVHPVAANPLKAAQGAMLAAYSCWDSCGFSPHSRYRHAMIKGAAKRHIPVIRLGLRAGNCNPNAPGLACVGPVFADSCVQAACAGPMCVEPMLVERVFTGSVLTGPRIIGPVFIASRHSAFAAALRW